MGPRKRNTSPNRTEEKSEAKVEDEKIDLKAGGIPYKRIAIRVVMIAALIGVFHWYGPPERDHTLVRATETTPRKSMAVPCSSDYKQELKKFKGCVPTKCGRFVRDNIVSQLEASNLLRIAQAGLSKGVANGGVSILDLHSGALTKGDKFVNIYAMMNSTGEQIFTEDDFSLYRRVKNKIHNVIAEEFGIPTVQTKLYLTKPTFFSKMTTKRARTIHDEYWHPHIDKVTYGSFHYTSLLYLTTFGEDFTGGRFIFIDKDANRTIEPRLGL